MQKECDTYAINSPAAPGGGGRVYSVLANPPRVISTVFSATRQCPIKKSFLLCHTLLYFRQFQFS
jgi:hypothetical protein